MFISKDGLTVALDTISKAELGNSAGNTRNTIYWIAFSLKTVAGSSQSSFNGVTSTELNEVRFDYGTDKSARDIAYNKFVEKFSFEL